MESLDTETAMYGQGWAFPPTFMLTNSEDASCVAMSRGAANVEQSMRVLFQTQPGERIMRGEFGCDMQSIVFSNVSEAMLSGLRRRILDSVARCEPRAQVLDIGLQHDGEHDGFLRVDVTYRLAGQNQSRRVSGALDVRNGTGGGF